MPQDYLPVDLLAILTGQNATQSAYPSFQEDLQGSGIEAGKLPSQTATLSAGLDMALQKKQEEEQAAQESQLQQYMNMPMGEQSGQSQDAVFSLGQMVKGGQKGMIGAGSAPVTQRFGNRSSVEKYSGGVNLGADLGTAPQTKLAVPPVGEWEVITASAGWNGGSGNLVKARNTQTGEVIGFEHLSQIGVKPGQKIPGGTIIGLSGGHQSGPGRGNSTGAHSSIIYMDSAGRYKDILKSPYSKYLFGG